MFASHQPLNLQSYQIPDLDYLIQAAEEVRAEYDKVGNDAKRLAQITHLETAIRQIKHLHDKQNVYYSNELLKELAFAAWLACLESIEREYDGWPQGPDWSKLYVILKKKLKFTTKPQIPDPQKMTLYNQLYEFEFTKPETKLNFPAVKLNPETEKNNLLLVMRKVAAPVLANKHEVLDLIAVEKAMDAFLDKIYDLYMAEAKSDNAEHRLFARLLKAVRDLNVQETKEKAGFLSFNQRIKMGMTFFIVDTIKNYKKYSLPWLWSPNHSTMHRLGEQAFFGNYDKVPTEVKLECLCAIEKYLEDFESRKDLEETLSDRKTFPKEAPVYINTVLRPITHKLRQMIDAQAPLQPKLSKTAVTVAAAAAAVALMPGVGAGIAIGFGAGLANPAAQLRQHFDPITGTAMRFVFGDGGQMLADYGTTIFFNETLKFVGGALVGGICAALAAATGVTIVLGVTEFTPAMIKNLTELYHQICNHPDIKPVLDQKLFNTVDPRLVACLLNSPAEIFADENKEKIKQLSGDAAAMDRLFAHHKELAVNAPKAAQPNQVLKMKT